MEAGPHFMYSSGSNGGEEDFIIIFSCFALRRFGRVNMAGDYPAKIKADKTGVNFLFDTKRYWSLPANPGNIP